MSATVDPYTTWFSAHGCVVHRDDRSDVYVGGVLIGSFAPREASRRNALLVMLGAAPGVHLGRLARAFGVSDETLRRLRRLEEQQGLAAVCTRKHGGSRPKVTARLRSKLVALFEAGCHARAAHARLGRRPPLSLRTVEREYADWKREQTQQPVAELPQTQLPLGAPSNDVAEVLDDVPGGTTEPEKSGASAHITPVAPGSARYIQHLGTWVMLAMVERLGLYARAERLRHGVEGDALRIALDAVVAALSIEQGCVEGVRRLATPSGPALLRASRVPSASWTRRVLGQFSQGLAGGELHLAMARTLLAMGEVEDGRPTVFYVDNHLRPYTGAHTIRRGWRMQDRRVVPGCTDYYVHDFDGRPVMRRPSPPHAPLTDVLLPIGEELRLQLGDGAPRILLAFDRAGSFPEQLASLRDQGFDLVTYERRPYATLPAASFTQTMACDDELLGWCESRANLRAGRGRVRRICVREQDGRQINILAVSEQPAEWLVGVMRGRWVQENAFKHGVARWGINQLDGRAVQAYPPDTIVPNPARRRLDHAIRLAAVREGDMRNELARLGVEHRRWEAVEQQLQEALVARRELEAQRPLVPRHAALRDTELADRLVRHTGEYKVTLDTVRIACANAEADLALLLAPHLARPAEAKRVVANLLAAPGHVKVAADATNVTLLPAANRDEQAALAAMLSELDAYALTLPEVSRTPRPLRFRVHT